jgi:hypothetical protein
MRRRIALQLRKLSRVQHFVRNLGQTPLLFREAFGVRARPRAALDL